MVNHLIILSLAILLFISSISCHMEMKLPSPRKTLPTGGTDYDMSSPLGAQKPFPCGGKTSLSSITTWNAGETVTINIEGGAPHGGGHCQFAISPRSDQKRWIVLADNLGRCPLDKNYSFKLPGEVPSGDYVFAWTWINAVGNRE